MNSNKIKNSRGITLIALVITIIVMLVLVAVTISMAVNGGLFDYAGKAVGDTEKARDEEQELANLESNMPVEELIEKYTGNSNEGIDISKLNIGDYVNYPVTYTNVGTCSSGDLNIPKDEFTGWRILSKETDEKGQIFINLISAGIPLHYVGTNPNQFLGDEDVEKLTTGFLEIEVNVGKLEVCKFHRCGFNIGEDKNLKNVFQNNYTQGVRSLKKEDIEKIAGESLDAGDAAYDEKFLQLFATPCKDYPDEYGMLYLANSKSGHVYGIGYTGYLHGGGLDGGRGVKVVVSLNTNVQFKSATEKINKTTTWDITLKKN